MIRFKLVSKNGSKSIYSFEWLSVEEGTIEIDTDTGESTLLTWPEWMNERDKKKIVYIAGTKLKQEGYPDSYIYATH